MFLCQQRAGPALTSTTRTAAPSQTQDSNRPSQAAGAPATYPQNQEKKRLRLKGGCQGSHDLGRGCSTITKSRPVGTGTAWALCHGLGFPCGRGVGGRGFEFSYSPSGTRSDQTQGDTPAKLAECVFAPNSYVFEAQVKAAPPPSQVLLEHHG